ncbi:MAG: hypothetical protein IMF06_14530 [Proteobacteria bacterium]|nr:hypothetical protein [Pseudomonadota bacterium]
MVSSVKNTVNLVLFTLIAGCVAPAIQEDVSTEFSKEGLHAVRSSGFDEAYVHPDAGLAEYKSVNIEALQSADVHITQTVVSGTTRRDWQMTTERQANLANAWGDACDRAFSRYSRDSSAGKMLKITSKLTRVTPGRTSSTNTAVSGQIVIGSADTVDVEIEIRLYDQSSEELLAVIRDRRTIATILWSKSEGANMGNVFNSWAGLLYTRVSGE